MPVQSLNINYYLSSGAWNEICASVSSNSIETLEMHESLCELIQNYNICWMVNVWNKKMPITDIFIVSDKEGKLFAYCYISMTVLQFNRKAIFQTTINQARRHGQSLQTHACAQL